MFRLLLSHLQAKYNVSKQVYMSTVGNGILKMAQ
jgi:hypothetical protein